MIKFSKMHGAGNDFILVDNRNGAISNFSKLALQVCDRHFGIGADGFMAAEHSEKADIKMVFYNADGTLAEMCGNGIRCFSKYVRDNKMVDQDLFFVETAAGIKQIDIVLIDKKESEVTVNMGEWIWDTKQIPVETSKETFINETIEVDYQKLTISCVLMGVPHGVVFTEKIDENQTTKYGRVIEKMKKFPKGINVNFVEIVDRNHIKVDTWERGAGKTLACGTGACASVIVANKLGLIDREISVQLPGGKLEINFKENHTVDMKGPATLICEGQFV